MKGTCDRCALSKVKCDRALPSCARCVSIGQELGIPPPCHYTVSLRSLRKKSGKKQGEGSSRKNSRPTHVRSDTASTYSEDASMSRGDQSPDPQQTEGHITSAPAMDPLPLGAFNAADMKADLTGDPFTMDLESACSDSYFPPMNSLPANPFSLDQMQYPNCLNARSESPSRTTYTSGFPDTTHSRQVPCCADLVCLTVHELWRASRRSPCANTQPPLAQTLDQALMLHRTALEAFATVLKCSCAEDQEFVFNAAFMLHSILGFYRTIVQTALPRSYQSSNDGMMHMQQGVQFLGGMHHQQHLPSSSSATTPLSTPGIGLAAPLRLGVYTMDAEDEHRFKLQVLRSEITKASRMMDDFVAKYCQYANPEETLAPPQSALLKYTLSMELKTCLDELDERAAIYSSAGC
ncbi:-like C6 zinc cluster transcription factor [Lecanosticta acicola]|uniref:-like C6 zinc cluster transcription factor n=1 Tax=Lecanosticta acicola TaxID=111012 RepID=A0AAI8YXU3_9PEZI|nr:-like C6 zinc cluster transcription factor [Lecanosticta acicola]